MSLDGALLEDGRTPCSGLAVVVASSLPLDYFYLKGSSLGCLASSLVPDGCSGGSGLVNIVKEDHAYDKQYEEQSKWESCSTHVLRGLHLRALLQVSASDVSGFGSCFDCIIREFQHSI